MDLNKVATQSEFADLVGASQPSIQKHCSTGLLIKGLTLDDWLKAYSDHLRTTAAGRGGHAQSALTEQRTQESIAKTAKLRLEYHKELDALVPKDSAAQLIIDMAVFMARELDVLERELIADADDNGELELLVNKCVGTATSRIQNYAQRLGQGLVGSCESIFEEAARVHSEMDAREL